MNLPSTDVVVVGAGACGSLVAKELAARGFSVVVLEAGKRYDPARDLANSEANAGKINWTEPRVFASPCLTFWKKSRNPIPHLNAPLLAVSRPPRPATRPIPFP